MNSKHQCMDLNDGHFIPVLGFGTATPVEVPKSKAGEATKLAIDAGFCHIDCAYLYQNEEEVGQAIWSKIADGTVKREDIVYTSKPGEEIFPMDEDGKLVFDTVDLCTTWKAMEKCKDAGFAKSIGVSNFNSRQLEMILNKPGLKYKPVCNQHGVVVLVKSFNEKHIKENVQVFDFQLTSEDMTILDGLNRNIRYSVASLVELCRVVLQVPATLPLKIVQVLMGDEDDSNLPSTVVWWFGVLCVFVVWNQVAVQRSGEGGCPVDCCWGTG
ncbi:Aldo-keto reductase family 1 member C1-like protein [Heterocephalus glaber]|uniref:Aldo-keto reductase family 1 member C1-like protein n=1 Tax=Heterocephalus glaber TaxID=10181 RepID=G5ANH6_HETGA|nr:Aldo-keto reductase family 1 member C1-like protein [Heterocephalus glaber]